MKRPRGEAGQPAVYLKDPQVADAPGKLLRISIRCRADDLSDAVGSESARISREFTIKPVEREHRAAQCERVRATEPTKGRVKTVEINRIIVRQCNLRILQCECIAELGCSDLHPKNAVVSIGGIQQDCHLGHLGMGIDRDVAATLHDGVHAHASLFLNVPILGAELPISEGWTEFDDLLVSVYPAPIAKRTIPEVVLVTAINMDGFDLPSIALQVDILAEPGIAVKSRLVIGGVWNIAGAGELNPVRRLTPVVVGLRVPLKGDGVASMHRNCADGEHRNDAC